MARVLTTAAGSDIGVGAIQSLEQAGHNVVAVDMDSYSAGLYIADDAATVPPATHDDWPNAMSAIVQQYDVDVVIPLIDPELSELSRLREALCDTVPILTPRIQLVSSLQDKFEACKLLSKKGLPVPETCLASDAAHLSPSDFPRFVKPRVAHGSRGTYLAHSMTDVEDFVEESQYPMDDMLIQQYIEGTEYTSNVTVTQENELLSIVTKEVPIKRGNTIWGVTRNSPPIKNLCEDVYESLDPSGPLNVQQILAEDGTPYILEINPRFSGSSCLTVEAGVNEFDLLVRAALGEEVNRSQTFKEGIGILRYTDQIYIREDSVLTEWEPDH
ncbi:ATP-grasp domain-containing protein [Halobellus litoreus]|uniref:ATP-grasp domain-containing protein n=1 Tax=Halobellus litoreus TaxID=755310 RepID=A0ABD6DUE9_9EURY|nr:ATP-grasp domain-containing protein [Halobellus litoreus]